MGYEGAWFAWVDFAYCIGYKGQNIFYVGEHFTWVTIFSWVAWVKYIFECIKIFYVGTLFFFE